MKQILLFLIFSTLAYSQSIKLISPDGGENWLPGAQYEIKWNSEGVSNLRIEISTDNGNNWNTISAYYPAFTGSYFWSSGNIKSNQAVIKITDADNDLISDISDSAFFINKSIVETENQPSFLNPLATLSVTNPNGGEILQGGSNTNITWSSTGTGNVDIDYSINGGANWNSIAANVSGSSQQWAVPNTPANQALIRISESGGGLDISDSYFFIENPQFSGGTTVKILPFGNSITFGRDKTSGLVTKDFTSYRFELWDLLIDDYNFDFIGSEFSGYAFFPDYQHGGFGGTVTAHLLNILETGINDKFTPDDIVTDGAYLNTYTPDIILIHAGTNDVSTDTTNIGEIIDYIHHNYSSTWMIIAKILNSDNADSPTYGTYNTNLEAGARKRINSGYKILIVDMYNIPGFNYSFPGPDMSDEIHPNASGYAKMGTVWYDALKLILPTGTQSPVFETPAVTFGTVNRPYNYTPHASNTETYSLITKPAGMTINSTTGKISWTPSTVGDYTVTVRATNSDDVTDQSFTIEVTNLQTWPSNLISYWKLDDPQDPSSNFLDSYGLNSGFSETTLTSGDGQVKTAFNFDGTDKVNIVDQPELNFANESFTIEAWINTSGSSNDQAAAGKYGRTLDESYWWLGLTSSDNPTFYLSFDTDATARLTYQATSSNAISSGWHHLAGVKDALDNIKIYVDGALKTTVNVASPVNVINSPRPLNIGHYYNSKLFNGVIDEVALYDRVLPLAEISDHYERGANYGKGYFDNFVLLSTKIFLEGPYNTTDNDMNTLLTVPLTSPYSQDLRTVSSVPGNTADWVLIELRSSPTGQAVGYKSAFLRNDGMVVGDDGASPVLIDVVPGSYYIILRHRNHLAVMSSNAVALDDNSSAPASLYDFTTVSSQFYGTTAAAKLVDGVWCMIAGDGNSSGFVTASDNNSVWLPQFLSGASGYTSGDYNLSGSVTASDNNQMWLINNGKSTAVP